MNNRTYAKASIVAAATLALAGVLGLTTPQDTQDDGNQADQLNRWTCPMHSDLRMPERGHCPMCSEQLKVVEIHLHAAEPYGDPYPFDRCPVSGQKLADQERPVTLVHNQRELRLCCVGCITEFEKNADQYWTVIDQHIVDEQRDRYPLTTCIVTGKKLSDRENPVDFVYKNRLIRLASDEARATFEASPRKNLDKLDQAIAQAQREGYPIENCVVSDLALDSMGGPRDVVVRNRLVRFCCGGCLPTFWTNPGKYFEILDEAESDSQ